MDLSFYYHIINIAMSFYNSDGSYASMCGNASMCVAHYSCSNMIAENNHVFLSGRGKIEVKVEGTRVEVNLGRIRTLERNIIENNMVFVLLDSGVRHLVCFVSSVDDIPKQKTKFIERLRYKYDANINFAFTKSVSNIIFTTYERGVEDITLACGTGGASVFYLAYNNGYISNNACLTPPSNSEMFYKMDGSNVFMSGVVRKIADIVI